MRYLENQTSFSKRQMSSMETLHDHEFEILYVQGKLNVIVDALFRINKLLLTELCMRSEDDEDSDLVALNVVGTVSRPMLSKYMMLDLLSANKED